MIINFSSIQMKCKLDRIEENFNQAKKFLVELPEFENHIVLLPELWSSGFSDKLKSTSKTNCEIIDYLKTLAKEKNFVIAGSYIVEEVEDFFNQLIIINSNGIDIAKYNKNYLFPHLNEKRNFRNGTSLTTINIWGIKIGLAICYDLRFPELFRNYAAMKNEICLIPAQWPTKRIAHFDALLKARAIENQMNILATNICGMTSNTDFGGSSSLIDFLGNIVFKLDNQEQIQSASIDLKDLYKHRPNFPVLEDANLDMTKEIIQYTF